MCSQLHPAPHLSSASGARSPDGGTEDTRTPLGNQMNRIFGNNKLLLRKSEFLGMFLVSITKLKLNLSSLTPTGSAYPNVLLVCIATVATSA